MSKVATSPTARLLQNSRLFSLPRPLPTPPLEGLSSTGIFRASDTATTPYPTHQAITTTKSSLHRGDFGLKRALPAKTTQRTSTPHIRIKAQDTYEHITDFASAADHTQTREKWLEMGVPIVRIAQSRKEGASSGEKIQESVFEGHIDSTDPDALNRVEPTPQQLQGLRMRDFQPPQPKERWKYTAPHIGSMSEGEFQTWVEKTLQGRRGEWREFLRREEMKERLGKARRNAREEGRTLSPQDVKELKRTLLPTNEQMPQIEKGLRDLHLVDGLSSNLSRLITDFLDLPPPNTLASNPASTSALRAEVNDYVSDRGPPTTAPNAGLSHLRTNAIMENHPIFGPQKHRAPIQARVVRPRIQASGSSEYSAKLGVAGFVASDPISQTYTATTAHTRSEAERMSAQLDPDLAGGNKMWMHPEHATVDEKGRIFLGLARADKEAIAVKMGEVEDIRAAKSAGHGVSGAGVSSTSDAPSVAPRPRIEGFDRALGGSTNSSRAGDEMRRFLEEQTR